MFLTVSKEQRRECLVKRHLMVDRIRLGASTQTGNRVIEAKVMTQDHRGDTALIPRLALDRKDRVRSYLAFSRYRIVF
jgi:hypothetical protein